MVYFCVVLVRRCLCCACCTNSLTMEHCTAVARKGIRITIKLDFIFLDVLILIRRRRTREILCLSTFCFHIYELHFIKLPVMVFDNEISTHTHKLFPYFDERRFHSLHNFFCSCMRLSFNNRSN